MNPQALKLLFEVGPLAVFFIANYLSGSDFKIATASLMVATIISLSGSWGLLRKIPVMPLIGGALIMLFGGLTLYFDDRMYKMIQPTVVNIFFASVLLTGLFFRKLFLKMLLEDNLKLQDEGWFKLTVRWSIFFLILAVLNEVFRYPLTFSNLSEADKSYYWDLWLNFKVFGIFPLTLIFTISQFGLIQKYIIEDSSEKEADT